MKVFVWLFLVTFCFSCQKLFHHEEEPFTSHILFLSIEDDSGFDLVKKLALHELNPDSRSLNYYYTIHDDLYTLDAVYPDLNMDPVWRSYNTPNPDIHRPDPPLRWTIKYDIKDGRYYLLFDPSVSYVDKTSPAPKITYKLSCHQIFGDDELHEIVTYWKPHPSKSRSYYQICYRIEYAGNKITNITYDGLNHLSYATLVITP